MPNDINILLGKNIQLIGFENLERTEIEIINKLLAKYLPKLENQVAYSLLKIRLRQHKKQKSFSHELRASLIIRPGERVNARLQYKNLYKGFSLIMKKLLSGIEHKVKKKLPQHPIRKITRRL